MSHWIVRAAERAGIDGLEGLDLPRDVGTDDAWSAVVGACRIAPPDLAAAIADAFGMDVADLSDVEPTARRLLSGAIARKHGVVPVRDEDRFLVVATSNPADAQAEQDVTFASGRAARFAIAPPGDILDAIDLAYPSEATWLAAEDGRGPDGTVDIELDVGPEKEPEAVSEADTAAGPVVRLTKLILHEAVARGASDVHLQPMARNGLVRFRLDGVLHNGTEMPLSVLTRVVSRIKIMASLDITDRLRPQDGRARIVVDGRKLDLRVSTVPTRHAEKAVVRILDPQGASTLDDTGIEELELAGIRRALSHRHGIVVVTGPTGSGKTTTLYGALREIATEDVNIMTVEDPIEYDLPGLTQIQVEQKQGMTFASALRAILRQDPDVILVGEIRDVETAQIAARASLTGHLVLASLHTNDAVGSIRRFLDLGLDPATVGETLRAVLAQRLVRRLCPSCAEPVGSKLTEPEERLAARFGVSPSLRATGCPDCNEHGYAGRLPVTELMIPSPELVRLVLDGGTPHDLQAQARKDGMRSLLESALARVRAGKTDLREVDRVVGREDVPAREAQADPVEEPVADRQLHEPAEPPRRPELTAVVAEVTALSGTRTPPRVDATDGAARVLIVDDDPPTRVITRTLLKHAGYSVVEAADGAEALERLAGGERFDAMVLDLEMPKLGGREVLSAVREWADTATLPVIVLTSAADKATEVDIMERGADDYIRKPIERAVLEARLRAVLFRARSDAESALGAA